MSQFLEIIRCIFRIISHPDDEISAAGVTDGKNVVPAAAPGSMEIFLIGFTSGLIVILFRSAENGGGINGWNYDGRTAGCTRDEAESTGSTTRTKVNKMRGVSFYEVKYFRYDEFSSFSCGKLFRTEDEVHFHAVKSGHANFSESTDEVQPLTEEEKRSRMLA